MPLHSRVTVPLAVVLVSMSVLMKADEAGRSTLWEGAAWFQIYGYRTLRKCRRNFLLNSCNVLPGRWTSLPLGLLSGPELMFSFWAPLPLQHFLVWHNINKQFYAIIGCQRGFNNVIDPGRYKAKLDINHKKLTLWNHPPLLSLRVSTDSVLHILPFKSWLVRMAYWLPWLCSANILLFSTSLPSIFIDPLDNGQFSTFLRVSVTLGSKQGVCLLLSSRFADPTELREAQQALWCDLDTAVEWKCAA